MAEWEEDFNLSEDEGEQGMRDVTAPKDNIIIALDARSNMLVKNSEGATHLSAALMCAADILRRKITMGDNSKLGVLLMGTREKKNILQFDHIYSMVDLDVPSVDAVQRLRQAANDADGAFSKRVGSAGVGDELPLWRVLQLCLEMFKDSTKTTDKHRIFVFTNDDSPSGNKQAAYTKAADAANARTEISLFPIQHPSQPPFDARKFWQGVVVTMPDVDEDISDQLREDGGEEEGDGGSGGAASGGARGGSGSGSGGGSGGTARPQATVGGSIEAVSANGTFASLAVGVRARLSIKRTYARVPLTLGDGLHIGLCVYNRLYPAKKPSAKFMHRTGLAPVKTESGYWDVSTGDVLGDHQLMKYHEVGGSRIVFSDEEAKAVRTVSSGASSSSSSGSAAAAATSSHSAAATTTAAATSAGSMDVRGLRLMGFKPRSSLREYDTLRSPYFLYPSERDIAGSTALFRALWQRMLDRDVIAIGRFAARNGATPRFVALLPERERISEAGNQMEPPGFYAVVLPYADDIRQVRAAVADAGRAPSAELLSAAEAMVSALSTEEPYSATDTDIANPFLQQFYSGLEAVALGTDESPDVDPSRDDRCRPANEQQVEVAGEQLAAFVALSGIDHISSIAKPRASAGVKRKAADALDDEDGSGGGAKRPKKEAPDAAQAGLDVAAAAAEGRLASLTNDVLKAACEKYGLKKSGNKGELVARLSEHLAKAR